MLSNTCRKAHRWVRTMAMLVAIVMVASVLGSVRVSAQPIDYKPEIKTYTPPLSSAIELLQKYGIVKGDQNGNLQLNNSISRAEMVTILVRMLGKESDATRLYGTPAFSDTAGHWANGYIAVAKQLGIAKGYENWTFRPDNSVSYAEAEALLLRVVGKDPGTGPWPDAVINQAISLGIQPPDVSLRTQANDKAIRLHVFQSLFLAGTRIELEGGKTAFQTYLDQTPPALNVDALPGSVTTETVTISGSAPDAVILYVDSKQVTLSTSGSFQSQVRLVPGLNVLVVEAFDAVGNRSTKSVATTLANPPARIEVSGPSKVQPGTRVQYAVQVYDANGVDLGTRDLKVQVVGNIGSYDIATNTLSAGNAGATGKLVFTAGSLTKEVAVTVEGLASRASALRFGNLYSNTVLTVDKTYTIQVEVVDANGVVTTDDAGRSVTLTASGDADVTVTPSVAYTVGGKATFTVRPLTDGELTLRATSTGLTSASATLQAASSRRVVLRTDESQLTPDGESEAVITAHLVNESGSAVINDSDRDIRIELDATGPGYLSDDELTIPRGRSSSDFDEGVLRADDREGTVEVTGQVVSGPSYTVIPVDVKVAAPRVGDGARLEITGPTSAKVDSTQTYTVRVTDANGYLVTNGSYAFQISISTSNNETKTDGIPDGVTVSLGDTGYNPVDDGRSEGSSNDGYDVIARTTNGKATIQLSYSKSGHVTIKPVLKGYTSEAYDSNGNVGAASSTTSIPSGNIKSVTTAFHADPAGVKLEVDSTLGKEQPGGALSVGSSTAKIRARIVDEDGNWIPGVNDYTITIQKEGGSADTSFVGNTSVRASDGIAEFTVRAGSEVGTDIFSASARTGVFFADYLWPANEVGIDVENKAPVLDEDGGPFIISINGYDDENDSLTQPYFVGSDDDAMAIALDPRAAGDEGWAIVKVYRVDGSSTVLVHTSEAVQFEYGQPVVIQVPKSALREGAYKYVASVKNSRGESAKSRPSETVTMVGSYSSVSISSARFTGMKENVPNVFTVTTSSISCSGQIDPSRLTIVAGSTKISLTDATAVIGSSPVQGCTSSSSQSQFQLLLTDTQVDQLFSTDVAGNSPVLEAEAGWYVSPNRQMANEDKSGNQITALTYIDRAEVDFPDNRLYLIGGGFKSISSLDLSKISFTLGDKTVNLNEEGMVASVVRQSDTVYLITLKKAQDEEDSALEQRFNDEGIKGANITVKIDEGWYKATGSRGPNLEKKLYASATLSQVQFLDASPDYLRLTGSGFTGGKGDPSKMFIKQWGAGGSSDPNLSGGTASVKDDAHMTVTIPGSKAGLFTGSYVFFYGGDGWWVSDLDIPAYRTATFGVSMP